MNDQHHSEVRRQELSALMDGELSHDRALFALKAITEDVAVAAQWQRLHMLRHYLREAEVQTVTTDFLAGVRARLQHGESPDSRADSEFAAWAAAPLASAQQVSAQRGFWRGWRQQTAGLAIAASVAMLALFGFNALVLQPNESLPTATTGLVAGLDESATPAGNSDAGQAFAPRGNVLQDQFNATAIPVNYTQDEADFRQQLNDYMLRHSQLASGSGRVGFAAYAPLLSSDMVLTSSELSAAAAAQAARRLDQVKPGPLAETAAARR